MQGDDDQPPPGIGQVPARASSSGTRSLVWGWLLRQRGRGGLSDELSRTLVAAAEVMLSAHLTPRQIRAISRLAAQRLYEVPDDARSEICGHLEQLERLAPLLARVGRRFSKLSPDARRRVIQGCARSFWPPLVHGHAQLRHLVLMAYFDCSEAWPSIPLCALEKVA